MKTTNTELFGQASKKVAEKFSPLRGLPVTERYLDQLLTKIAKDNFPTVDDLVTRDSDSRDFHDCAVWSIKAALREAFEYGQKNASK